MRAVGFEPRQNEVDALMEKLVRSKAREVNPGELLSKNHMLPTNKWGQFFQYQLYKVSQKNHTFVFFWLILQW